MPGVDVACTRQPEAEGLSAWCDVSLKDKDVMGRILSIFLGLLLLIFIGATVYFGVADTPAPQERVEKVIPNEKLGA